MDRRRIPARRDLSLTVKETPHPRRLSRLFLLCDPDTGAARMPRDVPSRHTFETTFETRCSLCRSLQSIALGIRICHQSDACVCEQQYPDPTVSGRVLVIGPGWKQGFGLWLSDFS